MAYKTDSEGSSDLTEDSEHRMPEQYFDIPNRDFSKEPASIGEKIVTTGKMIAEPYARTLSKVYKKLRSN